jgi:hypothetical protein
MNYNDYANYANYDNYHPPYGAQWGSAWPAQQQPAPYQPQFFPNYYVPPASHPGPREVPHAQNPPSTPVPDIPAPNAPRKQPAKTSKEPVEPKYSARDLLDIVQSAIKVGLFTAKHGEKGKKLAEFGTTVRALGIQGSDTVLKSRLMEVLAFHEVRLLFYIQSKRLNFPEGSC